MSRLASFKEADLKNRPLPQSVVLLPFVGMIAVNPIVLWRAPKNQLIVDDFTFFLIKRTERLRNESPPPFNPNPNWPNLPGNTLLPAAR